MGSTRALTDSLGVTTDTYDYEAFGSTLNKTGTSVNNYLFTGEQYDHTLDQQYLRARYYDPHTARFTQIDEWIGNDLNPETLNDYLYVSSDPVNSIDPTGYFTLSDIAAALNTKGIQSAASTGSYRVFLKKTVGQVTCLAIEEVATKAVEEILSGGVYVLLDGDKPYVGRSKDFDVRFEQHKKNMDRRISKTLARFHMDYDVGDQRVVEQFFIDLLDSANPEKGTNNINSIAEKPASVRSKGLRKIFDNLKICGKK